MHKRLNVKGFCNSGERRLEVRGPLFEDPPSPTSTGRHICEPHNRNHLCSRPDTSKNKLLALCLALLTSAFTQAEESAWRDLLAERYTLMWLAAQPYPSSRNLSTLEPQLHFCYHSALRKFGVDEFDARGLFNHAAYAPQPHVENHFTTSLIRDHAKSCIATSLERVATRADMP